MRWLPNLLNTCRLSVCTCLGLTAVLSLYPTSSRALTSPPEGRLIPIHVQEAHKELVKQYGTSGIAHRLREIKEERLARSARGEAAATVMLNQSIPVIIGDYSNNSHVFSPAQYGGLLWATAPPGVMNMRTYYQEVSNGQYNVGGSTYGPYTADSTQASYHNGDNGFGDDFPTNAGGFVWSILQKADTGALFGINFGQYDNDGPDGVANSGDDDGVVDGLIFVFPDGDAADGDANNMWSHQNSLSFSAGGRFTTNDGRFGGGFIEVDQYVVCAGEKGDGTLNQIKPVGIFCHEWGHILGLPDLYDTDNSTWGVGTWCLMGYGNWGVNWNNTTEHMPTLMSAWCRVDLGWITPTVVTALDSVGIQKHQAYKLWEDAYQGGRYFLIELRDSSGSTFDQMLPAEGLLVWHCDDDVFYDNSDDNRRVVDLEEADGLAQIDNKVSWMDVGDMFPWGGFGGFDDGTTPNSRDVFGNPTGVSMQDYAFAPGPTIWAELVPRTLSGFTVSYVKQAFLSGWGFGSAQTNNGAVRFVAPQTGDLVEVLFGAHKETAENYSVRIFDNMVGMSPAPSVPHSTTTGSIPSYNSARYHEIALSATHSVNAGDTFLVDVASGPSTFTVPTLHRRPHSQNSWYSSTGAPGSYFHWTDKDVAIRARLDFASFVCLVTMTGDVNTDANLTSADIIYLVNFVFKGGLAPLPCAAAGDVDCSLSVTSADIIYMVNFVFKGGTPPCDVCPDIQAGGWTCP